MFMVAGLFSCDVNDFLPLLVGQMGYSKALCRGAIGIENSGKGRVRTGNKNGQWN